MVNDAASALKSNADCCYVLKCSTFIILLSILGAFIYRKVAGEEKFNQLVGKVQKRIFKALTGDDIETIRSLVAVNQKQSKEIDQLLAENKDLRAKVRNLEKEHDLEPCANLTQASDADDRDDVESVKSNKSSSSSSSVSKKEVAKDKLHKTKEKLEDFVSTLQKKAFKALTGDDLETIRLLVTTNRNQKAEISNLTDEKLKLEVRLEELNALPPKQSEEGSSFFGKISEKVGNVVDKVFGSDSVSEGSQSGSPSDAEENQEEENQKSGGHATSESSEEQHLDEPVKEAEDDSVLDKITDKVADIVEEIVGSDKSDSEDKDGDEKDKSDSESEVSKSSEKDQETEAQEQEVETHETSEELKAVIRVVPEPVPAISQEKSQSSDSESVKSGRFSPGEDEASEKSESSDSSKPEAEQEIDDLAQEKDLEPEPSENQETNEDMLVVIEQEISASDAFNHSQTIEEPIEEDQKSNSSHGSSSASRVEMDQSSVSSEASDSD